MPRRPLLAIALLAAILHGVSIARSPLPAQDGLKFLRVARAFHSRPWRDVVRSTDQHPLYPAAVALTQPVVRPIAGDGADSWRVSAQVVSAIASVALLLPIFALTLRLFGPSAAALAALLYVLLPLPAEIGRETLSDALALLMMASSLAFGEAALRTRRLGPAIGCGIAAGLGYLTRPEVAIAPAAVVLVGWMAGGWRVSMPFASRRLAPLAVAFLALVGSYALVKGEVSEKLALRRAVALKSVHDAPARTSRTLPPGLDSPRWDFSAKEESDHPARLGLGRAVGRLVLRWSEGMGLLLVPMTLVGAWIAWKGRADGAGFALLATYASLFAAVLVRHAMTFGYLSSRHTLSLVVVALPFASAGVMACVRAVREWRERRSPGSVARTPWLRIAAVAILFVMGLSAQVHHRPHPSRWGHAEAGRWIASHAKPGDAVLDTRGWASFVSGREAHDYWHVRQALTDPKLAFIVVGEDERTADSRRGETLRAVLAYAAEPAAAFPGREGGSTVGVRVYRFHPPGDWRGIDR